MSVPRQRGMTEQAAEAAIDSACRLLRLPTIRGQFADLAAAAAREQMSYLSFLAELMLAECDDRARRRSERRIKAAAMSACRSEKPNTQSGLKSRILSIFALRNALTFGFSSRAFRGRTV